MSHSSKLFCCNTGIYADGVLVFANQTCAGNSVSPIIVGENKIVSAVVYNNCSSGCNSGCAEGGASFTGILIDKSVTIILQPTTYTVPSGFTFVKVGTSTVPIIYTSGQTVPANTNGYLISN